jgi:hypothetical protein
MKKVFAGLSVLLLAWSFSAGAAGGDEITDWTRQLYESALLANTSPLVLTRSGAMMQAAVFDAINGIEKKYTPIHVEPDAPAGASRRAAAVQAAYAILVRLYPAQVATLNDKRAASLSGIASGEAAENSVSISRGLEWGQTVADAIWSWRSTDGFTTVFPPFVGGIAPGQWRPTPPGFLPGAGVQFATMTPWVMDSPSQFLPAGPPALSSEQYRTDFNEVKLMGRIDSNARNADQTLYANFWALSTANFFWNQVAINLAEERRLTFSEKSRLFAALNLAMADAGIGCWNAKQTFVFWRPVTAIPLALTDGNPFTQEDSSWAPLINTPNHPEYLSGHSCVSGAAGRVLASRFGDNSEFQVASDHPSMAGVTRSFSSFSEALEEVKNARIFGGIHFRAACNDGQTLGIAVADLVLARALLPVNGEKRGALK